MAGDFFPVEALSRWASLGANLFAGRWLSGAFNVWRQ